MNYNEYRKIIDNTPDTEGIKYGLAVVMLHPERLPLCVVSANECNDKIIKVPCRTANRYGNRVPVIKIGCNAFKDNKNVTDIILGSDICSIGAGAFAGCTSLERITIPKGVTSIREGTFAGCTALTDVYYDGTLDEWKAIDIVSEKRELDLGSLVAGSPVQEVTEERLTRIPGNEALYRATIHCRCKFPERVPRKQNSGDADNNKSASPESVRTEFKKERQYIIPPLDLLTPPAVKTNNEEAVQEIIRDIEALMPIDKVDDDDNDTSAIVDYSDEDYIKKAIEIAVNEGQVSASIIQRKLKLGYARAVRIIDELKERGFISPSEGTKPCKSLISRTLFEEQKLRKLQALEINKQTAIKTSLLDFINSKTLREHLRSQTLEPTIECILIAKSRNKSIYEKLTALKERCGTYSYEPFQKGIYHKYVYNKNNDQFWTG